MNENLKTCMFAVAAAAIACFAWSTGPSSPKPNAEDVRGQLMFPAFKDPLAVTRMEIVRFDDGSRKVLPFDVAQVKNRWSIPSHNDYPADAKDHLAEAATSLMGLKILNPAPGLSDEQGDLDQSTIRKLHNEYGVVDPDAAEIKSSDTGVGTRLVMKDKEGHDLLSLVIGKQVGDQANLRYVRYAGKDPVYVVEVDTSKLSTKFEDWIEKNLLKLNTMDLKQVQIQDYTFNVVDGRPDAKVKGQLSLEYAGSGDHPWKLADDVAVDKGGKPITKKMAADEELDTKKLDDLKMALDDLKIVDVNRKPAGLSQDLKATGSFAKDRQGMLSLQDRGFYIVEAEDRGKVYYQLLSNKGEIRLLMNDGVEYFLRFGEVAGESTQAADKAKDKKGQKKDEKKDEKKDDGSPGMNRYLFVMAEFNPDAIAKPVMEPLPKEEKQPAPKKDDKKGDKKEDKKGDKKDASAEKKSDAKDAAKKENGKKDETKKDEKKPDPKIERERIEKENKRKQEEYDEKIAKGKQHVKDLNARFAEWYYIISDDVYRKIHLGRDQIIKKKEKAKDKDGKEAGHDHDHGPGEKPGPMGQLEGLKLEGPGGEKK